MKVVSWNVNGIRSVLKKGFLDWLVETDADVVCLQETKISEQNLDEHVPVFPSYTSYWNAAERNGYSGVAILSKHQPISVKRGLGQAEFDREGRVLTAEYKELFIVNVYVPNSQTGYLRLPFRLAWDEALRTYLSELLTQKSVIVCGDFNVAHTELDVGIPDAIGFPGCSPEERDSFDQLLKTGFVDPLRRLHPNTRLYSWWSYSPGARAWNQGLRFDYLLISNNLCSKIQTVDTHRDVPGSDHGPVSLTLDFRLVETESIQSPISPSGQFGFGL